MSDEQGLDFLQSFLQQAQDDLKRPTSIGGIFGAVMLTTGFQVYSVPESKFFEGGSTEEENVAAHTVASQYAKDNGAEKNVSFAMRLTVIGGEQYPEPKVYQSDDGNYSRTIMNMNSRHPVFDQWDSPGATWDEFAKSFSGDHPVTAKMISNGKFYAHIVSVPSPYFDETIKYHPFFEQNVPDEIKNRVDYSPVDESKLKYVVQWDRDSDEPRYGDDGNLIPAFSTRIKAAFETRDELIAYAYELGVTGDEATAEGVPNAVGVWVGSDKEWAKNWPSIAERLQSVSGRPKPVRDKTDEWKWLKEEMALEDEDINGLLEILPPF